MSEFPNPADLTLESAAGWLERCYSDEDPITWNRSHTTVGGLRHGEVLHAYTPATSIRITYYGTSASGETREIRGTLAGMARDRFALMEREKLDRKKGVKVAPIKRWFGVHYDKAYMAAQAAKKTEEK